MDIEKEEKSLQKLEKKKKWDEASKLAIEIADTYTDQGDSKVGLEYLERAFVSRQKTKSTEAIIVLYRKMVNSARKGQHKTQKQLFRYAAAAIPIIEEYIQVLTENDQYLTKNGAMTRYFLGECREIVSGIAQRNSEYILAGKVFVEVGKKLSNNIKSENEAEEAFEKSRIIFSVMKNNEEIFSSLLAEAEINIRKYSLERGFYLFDEARNLFDDETHNKMVVDNEKVVYAEMGLQLLENQFTDVNQREIANVLISRSKDAHLQAKSLDEVSALLFEIGNIYLTNTQLEAAFQAYEEAIQNSQLVGDESVPQKIIIHLYEEGKRIFNELLDQSSRTDFAQIENLVPIKIFDKIANLCKILGKGLEVEEVALYIYEMGKKIRQQRLISDDFPYITRAASILINNSRFSGLHRIGDEIESTIDDLLVQRDIPQVIKLHGFLEKAYLDINDKLPAGWLNVKLANFYAKWGDHEQQLAILQKTVDYFQQADRESLIAFSKVLEEQFEQLKMTMFQQDMISILGTVYLLLNEGDKYDSLYSEQAYYLLDIGQVDEALNHFRQNFEYLRRTKNAKRAINRSNAMIGRLLDKQNYQFIIPLLHNQVNFLIDVEAEQLDIIPMVQKLESFLTRFIDNENEIAYIDPVFSLVSHLYDHLGLKEPQGDAAFEIATAYINQDRLDEGFDYLDRAFQLFLNEELMDKVGLLLDYIEEKKDFPSQTPADKLKTDRFLEFLILCLTHLKQDDAAAELMLERAIQILPQNEEQAFQQFEAAKAIMSKIGTQEQKGVFQKKFASALLTLGKTEQGMELLEETQEKKSVSSLSMADTYLTSAEARFVEEDFDTYFTLVDQALNIYTELEMIQESSSIALTEAGKVWSIGNIPYTMIFLERAWAPLSESLITDLSKSADPLLRVLNSFIEEFFSQKRFDEALGFIELQERIYKHLNQTEMVFQVERKKVEAFIGRENYEAALSRVYDIATNGIEESRINETAEMMRDYLPLFVKKTPEKAKDLIKLYFQLLISTTEIMSPVVKTALDYYVDLALSLINGDDREEFYRQTSLVIVSLSELAEVEECIIYYLINILEALFKQSLFTEMSKLFNNNQSTFDSISSLARIKILGYLRALLTKKSQESFIMLILEIIVSLSKTLDDVTKDQATSLLIDIGNFYHKKKKIVKFCQENAIALSQEINSSTTTFKVLENQISIFFESENYLQTLEILDTVIAKLAEQSDPKELTSQFIGILDSILHKLAKKKKKRWLDLFNQKYQRISEKFMREVNKASTDDEENSNQLIDEMMEFTSKKDSD